MKDLGFGGVHVPGPQEHVESLPFGLYLMGFRLLCYHFWGSGPRILCRNHADFLSSCFSGSVRVDAYKNSKRLSSIVLPKFSSPQSISTSENPKP